MCPILIFEPWNIVPCLPSGHLIDREAIGKWDGVTHKFLNDWHCTLILSDMEAYHITIKAGFITDGGSIPRVFRNIINPWGSLAPAFFIHDILYATEYFRRSKCDRILLCACQALDAGWLRRNEIYTAVVVGGWLAWEYHTPETISNANYLAKIEQI